MKVGPHITQANLEAFLRLAGEGIYVIPVTQDIDSVAEEDGVSAS